MLILNDQCLVLNEKEDNLKSTLFLPENIGTKVDTYGIIGNDKKGEELLSLLDLENVDCSNILLCDDKPTTVKIRILAISNRI